MADRQDEADRIPNTLGGLREAYEETLPEGTLAYYSGGAADEFTLAGNERAWRERTLRPMVMVDVSERDLSVEVLGREIPVPFGVAPTAYHRLAHPEGEEAMARGAMTAGCPYTLSTLATARPEPVAEAAPDGINWFQVYVFRDRGVTRELVEEATSSGFEALILTVDLPVLGRRDREIATGFVVGDAEAVPGVHAAGGSGTISMQDTADLIDPSLTWEDVEELASWSSLPVLVKGVLRPDDARRAVEAGAAGVVVSNHGGRQLDGVLATADALGPVVEEIGPESTVMVDGGIRRGADVARALIMGADAVLIGRPCLWGLAAGGAEGVQRVLTIFADEFDRALALLGVPAARDLRGRLDLIA